MKPAKLTTLDVILLTTKTYVSLIAFRGIYTLVLAYFSMLLWNECLVGVIDFIHTITWLQSWGINFLISMAGSETNIIMKEEK
jgi:hypothetical protein